MEKTKEMIIDELVAEVKSIYPNRMVRRVDVDKLNGIKRVGICIAVEDGEDSVGANHYIEHRLQRIMDGDTTVREEAEMIAEEHDGARGDAPDVKKISALVKNKDMLLESVHRCLVNKEKNAARADLFPHRDFLDMTVLYYIDLGGGATVKITKQIMDQCGLTMEELDAASEKNDMNNKYFKGMGEVFEEMGYPAMPFDLGMYVISSNSKNYGAALITYADFIADVADKIGDDLIILPSSIHECIALSASMIEGEGHNIESMRQMVMSVNGSEVSPEEVLSDSVYYYDRAAKELRIA